MKVKNLMLVIGLALGLMTLMSSTCNKEEDPADPNNCTGFVSASSTGYLAGNYCFDEITTYTYVANSYVTLWAAQIGTEYGMDLRLGSDGGAPLVPGTYNCGPGTFGFVELIFEGATDNEFYKSTSGTLTITVVNETNFSGSFNVTAEGYYNKETIQFTGTVTK